ncbi:glycosyltransferase [bacterium]|nr:glycosyltransferase [bacterium]
MRVLILSNLYPPHVLGGYEILCEQVVRRLVDRGHEVEVLTSQHQSTIADPAVFYRVRRELNLVVPFERAYTEDRAHLRSVHGKNQAVAAEVLRSFGPDVVFAWSQLRITMGPVRAALAAGLPVAWAFNDANILSYLPRFPGIALRGAGRWLSFRFLHPELGLRGISFRHARVISEKLRIELADRGLTLPREAVLHQGIDLGQFSRSRTDFSVEKQRRFLYIGQLHHYKGVHTLLDAIGKLKRRQPTKPIRLTVVGDGDADYRQQLEQRAHSHEIDAQFLGRVPHHQIPLLHRDHDALVFPSIWNEPFGLTHLEAMASGLPVISTLNGGQSEFLRDGVNCLAFAPEDSDGLAASIERLFSEPGLAQRLADEGYQTVVNGYSIEGYVDGLEGMLRDAVGAHR